MPNKAQAAPKEPDGPDVDIGTPEDSEDEPPLAAQKLQIIDRTQTSITLGWFDASDYEDGNRFVHGPETVMNSGPLDGASRWHEFIDDNLSPDTPYCYHLVAFNENGESSSNKACAYTSPEVAHPIWSVQLVLKTADVKHEDTDDDI